MNPSNLLIRLHKSERDLMTYKLIPITVEDKTPNMMMLSSMIIPFCLFHQFLFEYIFFLAHQSWYLYEHIYHFLNGDVQFYYDQTYASVSTPHALRK